MVRLLLDGEGRTNPQPAFRTWPNRSKQGRLTVPFAVWIIHYCRLAEYAAQVEEGGVGTTTPAHSPLPVNIRLVACCRKAHTKR